MIPKTPEYARHLAERHRIQEAAHEHAADVEASLDRVSRKHGLTAARSRAGFGRVARTLTQEHLRTYAHATLTDRREVQHANLIGRAPLQVVSPTLLRETLVSEGTKVEAGTLIARIAPR